MPESAKSMLWIVSGVAACALAVLLFLEVEAQWKVAALAIGVVVTLLAMKKTGVRARIDEAS